MAKSVEIFGDSSDRTAGVSLSGKIQMAAHNIPIARVVNRLESSLAVNHAVGHIVDVQRGRRRHIDLSIESSGSAGCECRAIPVSCAEASSWRGSHSHEDSPPGINILCTVRIPVMERSRIQSKCSGTSYRDRSGFGGTANENIFVGS